MAELDPIQAMQEALASTAGEDSLCIGFAVVAEWLEADGSHSMEVIHSPMPAWHLFGLLSYARDDSRPIMLPVVMVDGDDDEDDDF